MDVLGEVCAEKYQGRTRHSRVPTNGTNDSKIINPTFQQDGRPVPLWKPILDENVEAFELASEGPTKDGESVNDSCSGEGLHPCNGEQDTSSCERENQIGTQMTNALCRVHNGDKDSTPSTPEGDCDHSHKARRSTRRSSRALRIEPEHISAPELPRKRFTEYQINFLRKKFLRRWFYPYFEQEEMEELANKIGLRKSQVHDWIRTTRARKWRSNVPSYIFNLVEAIRQQRCSFWVGKECFRYAFGEREELSALPIDSSVKTNCQTCWQKHTEYLRETGNDSNVLSRDLQREIPLAQHMPVGLCYFIMGTGR